MDGPYHCGGDFARGTLDDIVGVMWNMQSIPGWLSDVFRRMIGAFKRAVQHTGRIFASSATVGQTALTTEAASAPAEVAVEARPATPVSRAEPVAVPRTQVIKAVVLMMALSFAASVAAPTGSAVPAAPVAVEICTKAHPVLVPERPGPEPAMLAVARCEVSPAAAPITSFPAPSPPAVSPIADTPVPDTPTVAANVVEPIATAPGSPQLAVDPVAAAVAKQPAVVAPITGPKYIIFVDTGVLQQTWELSDVDFASLLTEGMSISGHMVKSVHVAGPDLANVVYGGMGDVEAVVEAFASGPPVDGLLAGVEMKVSAPAPGPYPSGPPPAGPKYILYTSTKVMQQTRGLSISDYIKLLTEGMSIPGYAVKFVRVRAPDFAHVIYETKEAAMAVLDAFANGPPVDGPLYGVEMRIEFKKHFRGGRGRGGRGGQSSAVAA